MNDYGPSIGGGLFWFAWIAVAMMAIFVAWLAWDVLYVNDPTRRRKRLEKSRQQVTRLDEGGEEKSTGGSR